MDSPSNLADSGQNKTAPDPASLGWTRPLSYDYASADPHGPLADMANASEPVASDGPAWAAAAAKYEWKDEYGDVGPEIPELEKELFHNEYISRSGSRFHNLLSVKVVTEAHARPDPIRDFRSAGLHPVMESNVTKCGYDIPTPIQAYTIPAVIKGHDVIATAQTGSGKTAAYLIPTISKLMGKAKKLAAPRPNTASGDYVPVTAEPLVLVVAPTRELCCQIFDDARRLCYRSMLRPCVAYGGAPVRDQRIELGKGCDVLIATPGRLIDFMSDGRVLSMQRLRFTIIDEADEMLHQDWEEEMGKIMSSKDSNEDGDHQYLLFSATFNPGMRKLARRFLSNDHVRIRIGRSGAILNSVVQRIIFVERNLKQQALFDLIIDMPPARTIIFVKSKKTADFVDDFLFNKGLPSTSIHSDRTQREREDSIRAFRAGKAPILVTTGVSARGIDVRNVMHVINFDLPTEEHGGRDEYIHRIGRTARIGNQGLATSFYNDDDEPLAEFLAKTLVECKQAVPEFLAAYKPDNAENVVWDDDSGAEDETEPNNDSTNNVTDTGSWGTSGQSGKVENAWVTDGGAPAIAPASHNWSGNGTTSVSW